MDIDERGMERLFRKLKLHDAYEAYREQIADPSFTGKSFDERIAHILKRQDEARRARKVAMLYRKSGVEDLMADFDKVDFSTERGIGKSQLAELCKCKWATNQNPSWLAFCGKTGTGKTFLAKAILVAALKLEIPGLFITARELAEKFKHARKLDSLPEKRKELARHPLIVLDDFSLKGFDENVVGDFMDLLEARSRKMSIIFTSQYPIEEWYDQMGGEGNRKDAAMDRIVSNTHAVNLVGESMRERYRLPDLFGRKEK